jgi:hypothetical protein
MNKQVGSRKRSDESRKRSVRDLPARRNAKGGAKNQDPTISPTPKPGGPIPIPYPN